LDKNDIEKGIEEFVKLFKISQSSKYLFIKENTSNLKLIFSLKYQQKILKN